jgi:hypothetical protein
VDFPDDVFLQIDEVTSALVIGKVCNFILAWALASGFGRSPMAVLAHTLVVVKSDANRQLHQYTQFWHVGSTGEMGSNTSHGRLDDGQHLHWPSTVFPCICTKVMGGMGREYDRQLASAVWGAFCRLSSVSTTFLLVTLVADDCPYIRCSPTPASGRHPPPAVFHAHIWLSTTTFGHHWVFSASIYASCQCSYSAH